MSKQPPTLYSVSKTFMWFAIVSILLTGCLAAIVISDHSREWRVWQRKFVEMKVKKIQEEVKSASQKVDKAKLDDFSKQLKDAESQLTAHRTQINKLRKDSEHLNTKILKTRAEYQTLKQYQDSYRYYAEEYTHKKDPKSAQYLKKLDAINPKVEKLKFSLEALEKEKFDKDASIDSFFVKEKTSQREINKILDERNRAEKKLANTKPTIVKGVLNAPMLDFLAPTEKVQQIVLDKLYDDYHFAKVQKVDRCTTCHLGIDQKGFENAPQPFKTHPNLALYLGSDSPHPIEKIGCTTCHGGNGHSVSFKDAAHMPQNDIQAKEWKKKYNWAQLEKWEETMLPLNHAQAACAKCHQGVLEVPQADKLNRGRMLAEASGCFACHKIQGFEGISWKPGPSLEHISGKLDRDWIVRWLHDPKAFREKTNMPKIFNLSNTSSPEDIEKSAAAIQGIATYLLKNSQSFETSKIPVPGDGARGQELVNKLGCLGCHSIGGTQLSSFGPELSGLGSKVTPEWLYAWVKNPKHYMKETRMPNLRLSDQEASDITSYLISLKNPSFDAKPLPSAKPAVVEEMVMHYLQETLRREEAKVEFSKMSEEERLVYLGKKSVAQQGCYSCHAIKGFENTKSIATELSTEGSKNLHQFDFGLTHIDHTRHAWIFQKLKEPRIFDHGKMKNYYEKLKMPDFGFTDDEADAITTFILSLREESIAPEMQKNLDLRQKQIERGRLLVTKFNCNGCHTLDGKEGALRAFVEDKGQAPPILDGEGAKTQEQWLHQFLKEPTSIRPWLTYRMPTFDFTEEELRDIVLYFTYKSGQDISYKGFDIPSADASKLAAGKKLFDALQCAKCHQVNPQSAAMGASFLAPDLDLTKHRLKPDWVKEWIKDPQVLQPDTMMPTFFSDGQTPIADVLDGDAQKQIEAIRDYLYAYQADPVKSKESAAENK